jgi:hypothetical protein
MRCAYQAGLAAKDTKCMGWIFDFGHFFRLTVACHGQPEKTPKSAI